MSAKNELYRFTIANGNVTAVSEVKKGYEKAKLIKPGTTYTVQGNQVIKVETKKGYQETSVYQDPDGDGLYVKVGETKQPLGSVTTGSPAVGQGSGTVPSSAVLYGSQKKFVFDAQNNVTAVQEVKNGYLKNEALWKYSAIEVIDQGVVLLQKVSGTWELYRDGNGDGVYTEIGQGFGNPTTVDLTGIIQSSNSMVDML
ncbi:hypothetical protein JCM16106_14700 [Hydrogenophilus islandicus]